MTEGSMSRKKINKKIAKILGFKCYKIKHTNSDTKEVTYHEAWKYPEEYKYLEWSSPNWKIPDFVGMIDKLRKIEWIL